MPLDVPATAFEVTLDNTLIAFSTSETAMITGTDLQLITLTAPAVPEPSALGLLGLAVIGPAVGRRARYFPSALNRPWNLQGK